MDGRADGRTFAHMLPAGVVPSVAYVPLKKCRSPPTPPHRNELWHGQRCKNGESTGGVQRSDETAAVARRGSGLGQVAATASEGNRGLGFSEQPWPWYMAVGTWPTKSRWCLEKHSSSSFELAGHSR